MTSTSRWRLTTAATAAVVLAAGLLTASATPSAAVASGPVIDQNFADPDIMKVGRTYYAYATNSDGRNITWATSTDLTDWAVQETDALPALGAWADPDWSFPPGGSGDHGVWAPEVFAAGPRSFVMWYTAHDRASGKQCIGAATATAPGGPFVPRDTALVCTPETGGAIDASSFAENGRRYILWKNDGNCCSQDTWLHLQQVSADGLRRVGAETELIKQNKPFEGTLVEAPTLWKRGSTYVLFYSANFFGNGSYVSSYATSTELRGPYTKAAAPLMTTDAFAGTVRGPGGQDVVTGPDGKDRIVFHGWNPGFTYRAMYSQRLDWQGGRPIVEGAKIRYEAEDATFTRANARYAAGGASNGVVVGGIDFDDSRVTFTVYVPRAGTYRLYTRYANGSDAGAAAHTLSVNGASAGTVDYPFTGWDNWQVSERAVTLRSGTNTISYAKGANFAELDAIDIA
ncbi:beta-xylosidase [Actinoplanes lutulentus]|uniref:Carbohydrate-binding protein with CBM35 doain n=1 Tax=Actinoplanes lutulentus TaxID=1287878 RepID=A0A327ZB94_9ACTN|nr:family 43 glycosylhydrolase [Actinoplanes lutulentus]MBB2948766.1 beta-xylosidase [Actinoplanes lutulentus]RAK29678.1 carbohydrate-binding protein with CBM35 doain [Actinoplanes lutulentus]